VRTLQLQRAFVEVVNQDGSIAASQELLSSQSVSTFTFAPWTAPAPLDAAFQTPANLAAFPRYIRIQVLNAADRFLNFRELMAFDAGNVNVALRRPTTGALQYLADPDPYFNAAGNNGVINMDAASGDMVHSVAVAAGGRWTWAVPSTCAAWCSSTAPPPTSACSAPT